MSKLLAIDNGGFSTCVFDGSKTYVIPSQKGIYKEMNLKSKHGDHDYVLELEGKKYVMGTLAVESKFPLEMYSDSKANRFYDLSVLLSVYLYGSKNNTIVVSVPISRHTEEEKKSIKDRLEKRWNVIVNGEEKDFIIDEVLVAPETVSGFWVDMPRGKVRWIDWGSRTVGYGTTLRSASGVKFLNKESGTFEKDGMNAKNIDEMELEHLVEYVAGRLLALWDKDDKVINIGGGMLKPGLLEYLKDYFPNSDKVSNPQTFLVTGMYRLAEEVLVGVKN